MMPEREKAFRKWREEGLGADIDLNVPLFAFAAGAAHEREERAQVLEARAERTVTIRESMFYRHCAEIVRKQEKK